MIKSALHDNPIKIQNCTLNVRKAIYFVIRSMNLLFYKKEKLLYLHNCNKKAQKLFRSFMPQILSNLLAITKLLQMFGKTWFFESKVLEIDIKKSKGGPCNISWRQNWPFLWTEVQFYFCNIPVANRNKTKILNKTHSLLSCWHADLLYLTNLPTDIL